VTPPFVSKPLKWLRNQSAGWKNFLNELIIYGR
jgi:hypothetical protein